VLVPVVTVHEPVVVAEPVAPVAPVGPGTVEFAPVAPVAPVDPAGPVSPNALLEASSQNRHSR
jgi:hypothetical protein